MGQNPDILISESIYLLKKQNITEFVIGEYSRLDQISDIINVTVIQKIAEMLLSKIHFYTGQTDNI